MECHFFISVIEAAKYDRDTCFVCYVVESGFPFSYFFSCAFGGDGDDEMLVLLCDFNGLIDEVHGALAINGESSQVTKQPSEREGKQFLLG